MSRIIIPDNIKGKALFDFLVKNKKQLIAQKKAGLKYTDAFLYDPVFITKSKTATSKAIKDRQDDETEDGTLKVKVVGSSAWWCDSDNDVLTDTCYDKSIKEKGLLIPHIADHIHTSTSHVGDVQAVYTQKIALKELGLKQDGETTCFVMESKVREDYNENVYKFYKNGKINQHSIGLIYVSIGMCINDKDYLPEYTLWEKYYDKIINKDKVDERGYFWIVPEIKIMENSCVLFGANVLTPTLLVEDTNAQPSDDTEGEPSTKTMVICPNCQKSFQAQTQGNINCPDCGQYVSPGSNTTTIATFNLSEAIAKAKFFQI